MERNARWKRLQQIRNLTALGCQDKIEYSDCLAQIVAVAQAKSDVVKPAPERKKRGTRDRKERSGQDRDEE